MNAILPIGDYAQTAYCFEKLDIRVYCMEELCYVLKENAFLLSPDIMSDDLVSFIGEECGLSELAKELYALIRQKGTLAGFVSLILEYVGLYEEDVMRKVESTLKLSSGMTDYEKRKLRIDYLVEKKRYSTALEGYDDLLKSMELLSGGEREAIGKVIAGTYHNKGVVCANLLRYGEAADCFRQAYDISGRRDSFMAFLSAKRMELAETDYVSFVAALDENHNETLALEKDVEEIRRGWRDTPKYASLEHMRGLRLDGDLAGYLEESRRQIEALKDSYRIEFGE